MSHNSNIPNRLEWNASVLFDLHPTLYREEGLAVHEKSILLRSGGSGIQNRRLPEWKKDVEKQGKWSASPGGIVGIREVMNDDRIAAGNRDDQVGSTSL